MLAFAIGQKAQATVNQFGRQCISRGDKLAYVKLDLNSLSCNIFRSLDVSYHPRFCTDRCVRIQLIIGLDRYSQRGWHSEGVGTLVAAEIEVGPTTGVSVVR
jgi:hypothetical protein